MAERGRKGWAVAAGSALLVPVLLGARLYVGLSEAAFRKLVLSLLALSGVAMLVAVLMADPTVFAISTRQALMSSSSSR